MDEIDFQIFDLLKENSLKTWKELGESIQMTGRQWAIEFAGWKKRELLNNTIAVNELKLGKSIQAFITAFLKSNHHLEFQKY